MHSKFAIKERGDAIFLRRGEATRENLPLTQGDWLVFEGSLGAAWLEKLLSLIDNQFLCLDSGDKTLVQSHLTFLLEAQDLSEATPAALARFALIHVGEAGRAHPDCQAP